MRVRQSPVGARIIGTPAYGERRLVSRKSPRRAGSLKYQVNQLFASAHAIGESKHAAKRAGASAWQGRVFALRTDWAYRDATLAFARWAREHHGCHVVTDA